MSAIATEHRLHGRTSMLAALLLVTSLASATPTENLLRNDSFEGALLYGHGIETNRRRLVRGDAAVGEYALRIEGGVVTFRQGNSPTWTLNVGHGRGIL